MSNRIPVIDADGHVVELPSVWAQYVDPAFRARAPRFVSDDRGRPCLLLDDQLAMRHAMVLTYGPDYRLDSRSTPSGGWDPRQRLKDMDTDGIDVAVLFPSISFYFSELKDPLLMDALCRAYNDWLADFCRTDPTRLKGIAMVPLVDVELANRELERAVTQHDFRGVFVRPNPYAGKPIYHPMFDPFWERVAALGVPATIHEGLSDNLPTVGSDRFDNPALLHVLSHPFEQMTACAGLIMTGVLERFPTLKVAFLESGAGWLPYWLGRLDGHVETWGVFTPALTMKPSEYFRRQCVISTDPEEEIGALVVQAVGDECVVWASDYPHPDAHFPGSVAKSAASLVSLSAASQRKVFADNAARLYGITLPAR